MNLAKIWQLLQKKGYRTYCNYWNANLAKKITKKNKVDIFICNTLSHIKNYSEIFRAIDISLNKKGILILEDPSLLECLKNLAYDQFYCEHIYVFSTIALQKILDSYGFEIFDIDNLKTHGGSNRYYIKRKSNKYYKIIKNVKKNINKEIKFGLDKFSTYKKFSKKVEQSKNKLKNIFNKLTYKKKKIIGYGATAKSCTVLNYCNIKKESIQFFYDTTSFKIGNIWEVKLVKNIKN